MTQNPILKVLSTLKKHQVKNLLIGGQACIIYGAAEFSRDSDFIILSTPENLKKLNSALKTLKARLIYLPHLEAEYLERGHACHFRCSAKDVKGLRIDIIAKLRGCDSFDKLWKRRKRVRFKDGGSIDVIGLSDLVQSKKTQRDKDWLMLKRLVENDIFGHDLKASDEHIKWWLKECRNAELLMELSQRYPKLREECVPQRALLSSAIAQDAQRLNAEFQEEEMSERHKDREYWEPLRKELEALRHKKEYATHS